MRTHHSTSALAYSRQSESFCRYRPTPRRVSKRVGCGTASTVPLHGSISKVALAKDAAPEDRRAVLVPSSPCLDSPAATLRFRALCTGSNSSQPIEQRIRLYTAPRRLLHVAGSLAAVGPIKQFKFTVPVYPFDGVTEIVTVFPVVALGSMLIEPPPPPQRSALHPGR